MADIERGEGELTLQLTQEQIKNASQAYYTVLQRNSFGDFAITTANFAIEPDENGILHIPNDPMLLHVATDMEEAPAPLTCVQAQKNGEECVYRTINCLLTPGHEFMELDSKTDEEVVITVRNISYKPQRDAEGRMKPFFEWKSSGYEMYPLCLDHGFRVYMKPASAFDKDLRRFYRLRDHRCRLSAVS